MFKGIAFLALLLVLLATARVSSGQSADDEVPSEIDAEARELSELLRQASRTNAIRNAIPPIAGTGGRRISAWNMLLRPVVTPSKRVSESEINSLLRNTWLG